jgi:mono/diheme cytochrome c family protein
VIKAGKKLYRGELMRTVVTLGLALWVGFCPASAQPEAKGEIQNGHRIAATICAVCHVGAPDQAYQPIMKPPAPSFESIAQRQGVNAESLRQFITTTHRGLDTPKGMPDPELMDYQVKEVIAYILSLRK